MREDRRRATQIGIGFGPGKECFLELNVVGVGIGADMDGMLRPLAQASRGEAYHAIPDIADPKALAVLLRQIYREIGGRRPIQLIATQ